MCLSQPFVVIVRKWRLMAAQSEQAPPLHLHPTLLIGILITYSGGGSYRSLFPSTFCGAHARLPLFFFWGAWFRQSGWNVPELKVSSSPASGKCVRGGKLLNACISAFTARQNSTKRQMWRCNLGLVRNQLQTYLQMCFHISSAVLKFDDVTMWSNPQMLLFLILIMQVAIKILFSQCKVPIELSRLGVMKRSCVPGLRKNVFDCRSSSKPTRAPHYLSPLPLH